MIMGEVMTENFVNADFRLTVRAPARVDISSGAADWCGFCTVAAAVNLYAEATLSRRQDGHIAIQFGDENWLVPGPHGAPLNNDLIKAVIAEAGFSGYNLQIQTQVPRQAGLGGSGSLAIAILFGLQKLFNLPENPYLLAEKAQRIETNRLQTIQGYQDQYTPAFGGLLLMDFKFKNSLPIHREPYATVEQLQPFCRPLHMVIIDPGIFHDSGARNMELQKKYLSGDPKTVQLMQRLDILGRETKKSIIDRNDQKLWDIINENQQIMRAFGRSSEIHDEIIRKSLAAGAAAAKCTGSGNGALVVFCPSQTVRETLIEKSRQWSDVQQAIAVEIAPGVRQIEAA